MTTLAPQSAWSSSMPSRYLSHKSAGTRNTDVAGREYAICILRNALPALRRKLLLIHIILVSTIFILVHMRKSVTGIARPFPASL